jgi:hypothetical protein
LPVALRCACLGGTSIGWGQWRARAATGAGVEPGVALLVAGLALACYLQGAFVPKAQVLVAVPLVVGALLAPALPAITRRDLPFVLAAAGLAGWAVADGALTGHLLAGCRYFLLIAGVLGLAAVSRQLSSTARQGIHEDVGVRERRHLRLHQQLPVRRREQQPHDHHQELTPVIAGRVVRYPPDRS